MLNICNEQVLEEYTGVRWLNRYTVNLWILVSELEG